MGYQIKDTKPHLLLFYDIINTKNYNKNNIKINKKSYKKTLICYIGYVTIKDLKLIV